MSRKTFNDKTLKYIQQDPLIGIGNHVETITAVIYRGPYLDPGGNFQKGLSYCNGEIASGLEMHVILMEKRTWLELQIFAKVKEPDFLVRTAVTRVSRDRSIIREKRMESFYKSLLNDAQQKLVATYKDNQKDDRLNFASLLAGYFAYTQSYKIPKRMFGSHKLDYTKRPSPDIIFDIKTGKKSKSAIEHITIKEIQYNDYNDLRNTAISVSGVSSHIKNANVSDGNTLSINLRNGIESILHDDCEKRTIELHRDSSQLGGS